MPLPTTTPGLTRESVVFYTDSLGNTKEVARRNSTVALNTLHQSDGPRTIQIPASTTVTFWDASTSLVPSFVYLYFEQSGTSEVYVELRTTDDSTVVTVFAEALAAGVPFELGSDNTFSGSTVTGDVFGTNSVVDTIDRIRLRNESATAANVIAF